MKKKFLPFILIIIVSLLCSCSKEDFLSIHIIDVGQGDSILLKFPDNTNILIDSGTEDSERILKSYLNKYKVDSIDILIATHLDSDHIGSMDFIINNFEVNNFYMPEYTSDSEAYYNLIQACDSNNIKIKYLYQDDSLTISPNTQINILSPSYIQDNSNSNSIVFELRYVNKSFLFTGDAEHDIESNLVDNYNLDDVDFLKVGHHGSNSSSTIDFLEETSPDISVISCGYKNQYGHPHQETLNNLNSLSIPIYRTDLMGDIVFYSDGNIIFTKKNYIKK